jgi:hypothetical protein
MILITDTIKDIFNRQKTSYVVCFIIITIALLILQLGFHSFDDYKSSIFIPILFLSIMGTHWSQFYFKNGYYYYTHSQEYTKILLPNQILNLKRMKIVFDIFIDLGILVMITFLADLIFNSVILYVIGLMLMNIACVTIQQSKLYYSNFCDSEQDVDAIINNTVKIWRKN